MLKRKKVDIAKIMQAIQVYNSMTINYVDVELEGSLLIADKLKLYAYDAYIISCALKNHCPLISLDNGLVTAANHFGVKTWEVES